MSENKFAARGKKREQIQDSKEARATTTAAQRQKRIRISVSLTEKEHELVQRYAFENGTTVSGLIQQWIRENCD